MASVVAHRRIIVADLATYCAQDLVSDADLCGDFAAWLEQDGCDRQHIVEWLCGNEVRLSLAGQASCRVVQKLLEVLGGILRDLLVTRLLSHTLELLESPHGNHVLTKIIEVVPRPALDAIIVRLEQQGGRAVARHRFGCRVIERLVEHGTEEQLCRLMDQWVMHAEELSRHPYGNFVIQSLLEHGTAERRHGIVERLLPSLSTLAVHRTASHVVQQALNHSSRHGQRAMVTVLLGGPPPQRVADIAASRYGSYVVEELFNIFGHEGPGLEVREQLALGLPAFGTSFSFVRVAVTFGLLEEDRSTQAARPCESDSSEAGAPQEQ